MLLVIIASMALPIALLPPWVRHTADETGEQLLRRRLDNSLVDIARTIGSRWPAHRSILLNLAETPEVIASLRGRPDRDGAERHLSRTSAPPDGRVPEGTVGPYMVTDTQGEPRFTFAGESDAEGFETASRIPALPVRLPVHDPLEGGRIGTVQAMLRLDALLPGGTLWSGAAGSVLMILDETGRVPLHPVPFPPEFLDRDRFLWDGDEWLVVRRKLHSPEMMLALAGPLGSVREPFVYVTRETIKALLGVLLLALLLATVLTRRITEPIERLAVAADQIAAGRLERRVEERGPEEIRRLSSAFNMMSASLRTMLDRLGKREAVAAVGEFATALAHEVRNPLTSMRLDLERVRAQIGVRPERADALLARVLDEIDRLDRTVGGALRIARSGSLTLQPLDLREPIEAAIHASTPAFAERSATVEALGLGRDPIHVRGDRDALEQLFLNLLLNAAQSLPEGGHASVEVTEEAGGVRIAIRDSGRGISPEEMARVREPFYSTRRDGTGLGLPIAARIASAHGAELQIESVSGVGTLVQLTLPG
jgi:signal transduction histidine kinase